MNQTIIDELFFSYRKANNKQEHMDIQRKAKEALLGRDYQCFLELSTHWRQQLITPIPLDDSAILFYS
jgi:hypothetical protein